MLGHYYRLWISNSSLWLPVEGSCRRRLGRCYLHPQPFLGGLQAVPPAPGLSHEEVADSPSISLGDLGKLMKSFLCRFQLFSGRTKDKTYFTWKWRTVQQTWFCFHCYSTPITPEQRFNYSPQCYPVLLNKRTAYALVDLFSSGRSTLLTHTSCVSPLAAFWLPTQSTWTVCLQEDVHQEHTSVLQPHLECMGDGNAVHSEWWKPLQHGQQVLRTSLLWDLLLLSCATTTTIGSNLHVRWWQDTVSTCSNSITFNSHLTI